MNGRWMLASALGALLITGCYEEERGTEINRTIAKRWSREGISKLKLNSVHGSIDVKATSGNEIKLVAEGHFSGSANRALGRESFLKMSVSNGVLKIEERFVEQRTKLIRIFGSRGRRYIDYKLEVPADLAVVITNVSGEIDVDGISAPTELQTVNGSIDVSTPGAQVEANSVNGSIEAHFTRKFEGAKFHTVNGPVEVTIPADSAFVANVSQVNGGFESNIPVNVRRRGGSFSAVVGPSTSSPYELEVNTVNGDVSLIRGGSVDAAKKLPRRPAAPADVESPKAPELPQPFDTPPPPPPAPPSVSM